MYADLIGNYKKQRIKNLYDNNVKKQMSKIPALKEKVMQQAKSLALGRYVWDCGIGPQMG